MVIKSRRGYPLLTGSGIRLIFLAIIGCWLGSRPVVLARSGDPQAGSKGQTPSGVLTDPAYFEKLQKQADELRKQADELEAKLKQAAQPHLDAQSKAHGGPDQARRAAGATLDEINARMAERASQAAASGTSAIRIEPGMKMTVLMKKNSNHYTGTLVGVRDGKLLLQTIAAEGAKPSEFELKGIAAFQITSGIYALNPKTNQIVPAVTCYSLNRMTGNFDRMDKCHTDTYLAEHAKIVGPTKSTPAFFDASSQGTWTVGLPVPPDNSPPMIPGANFQQIITSKGVHTYDAATKGYTYKSHAEFTKEAQAQKDEAGKDYYKRQWNRQTQEYQLETNRVQAMQPVFTTPWYAQPQQPQSPPRP
jgi:hypothetical protein